MYNGIGLTTPRGSGTNGYIQANKAHVRPKKRSIDYQSEEELKKSEKLMFREPNKDILEHERKRRIESKCFELQDLMEEDGYTETEIKERVEEYREALLKADDKTIAGHSTHLIAAATQQKNERLKSALKISPDFEDGSSFNKKARIEAEKEKCEWLKSSSSSSSSSDSSDDSDSDSDSDKKNRKSNSKQKSKRKHSSSRSKPRKKSSKKSSKKKSKKSSKKKSK